MIQLAFLLVAVAGYLIDFTDSPSKRLLAGLVVAGMALSGFLPSATRARQRAPGYRPGGIFFCADDSINPEQGRRPGLGLRQARRRARPARSFRQGKCRPTSLMGRHLWAGASLSGQADNAACPGLV